MRKTNQKGITLIALIVTIIVLIIIAGVSIASLKEDNGIIKQVDTAKITQIEANAREQVKLACSAMRLAIAEASAQDNSYKAKDNAQKIQDVLLNTIKSDTKELEENGWAKGTVDSSTGKFVIIYQGDDYKNACNYDEAKITYTITLGQKSIEITDQGTVLKDSNGNDFEIDIDGNQPKEEISEMNEHGFYFDVPYTSGNNHIVFHNDGTATNYTRQFGDPGMVDPELPSNSFTYDYQKITSVEGGIIMEVSNDGKQILDPSTKGVIAEIDEDYNVYKEFYYTNTEYYPNADTEVAELMQQFGDSIIFREDDTVEIKGTSYDVQKNLEKHHFTVDEFDNSIIFYVSVDGKRIYIFKGSMIGEPYYLEMK